LRRTRFVQPAQRYSEPGRPIPQFTGDFDQQFLEQGHTEKNISFGKILRDKRGRGRDI
jgi:hypothetical protein